MKRLIGLMLAMIAIAGCESTATSTAASATDKHTLGDTGVTVHGSVEAGTTAVVR